MTLLNRLFSAPPHRRVDASLVGALAVNALAVAGLAWGTPHAAPGFALALMAGLGGLWACTRPLDRWYVRPALAFSLVLMVLGQLALAGNPRPWILNIMLTMSLLPMLQRAWIVAACGTTFALASGSLLSWRGLDPSPWSPALLVLTGLIVVQTLLLARAARRNSQQSSERFDIEFLVNAMGRDGPIRLGLDAVRAESALGERLKHVQQRMAAAVRQVHQAAHGVHDASRELDESGEALRERTERSAEGLRDAAMTLEQITVIVQSSAQAALEARQMAASASEQAVQGGALFEQVTARMHDIDRASRRITDVIGTIDGIAFQTNILALNAAVEAARAGEQGRGFAVVAAEVRSLALRASEAAAEIKSLIGASMETVRSGNELVEQAGTRMEEIVESVQKVGQVFENLSADTNEHAGSIEAVTRSVMELDAMTRQNVAVAATSRRIAHALLEQGTQLEQVLGSFKLGDMPMPPKAPPVSAVPPAPAVAAASQARQLATAVIQGAAKPRPAAAPPKADGDASNVTFF